MVPSDAEPEMPELPEVETVRRLLERTLVGHRIVGCEAVEDTIVFARQSAAEVESAMVGRKVISTGRRGKTFWLVTDGQALVMHLGMSGWVRALDCDSNTRLLSHGQADLDDSSGNPRFLKLMLTGDDGSRVAFTDGRRLARIWLSESVDEDPKVTQLGPDAYEALPDAKTLQGIFGRRKPAIKTLLLDQTLISGIGNWVADEVLYHAGIDPRRSGSDLKPSQYQRLHDAIAYVLRTSIDVSADHEQYPDHWLFVHRWGGSRGSDRIDGQAIVREQIGGRTTAWVPARQK